MAIDFDPNELIRKKGKSSGEPTGREMLKERGADAHPGFKTVEKKIGQRPGIRDPGAVLAAATRRASPAAKRANPRLKRVKG